MSRHTDVIIMKKVIAYRAIDLDPPLPEGLEVVLDAVRVKGQHLTQVLPHTTQSEH